MTVNMTAANIGDTAHLVGGPHRHYKPEFSLGMVNHPIAKRLDAILDVHSWSKNRYMAALREKGATLIRQKRSNGPDKVKVIPPRRASIRTEREETLNALVRAMIYRADYDPDAPFLFEVKASVQELAGMIGQLHEYQPGYDGNQGQYRHGRISYDPVLGAIEDLAAANLVLVVHEFDEKACQHKAMRIFFRPELFKSFGLSMKDTKAMLTSARKWMEKKGLIKSARQKRQAEVLRQSASDRIAGLDRPSLRNLLTRLKREFTGDNKRTKQIMDTEHRLKAAIKKQYKEKPTISRAEQEYRELCNNNCVAPIHIMHAKNIIKKEHPGLIGDEFTALLVKMLQSHI